MRPSPIHTFQHSERHLRVLYGFEGKDGCDEAYESIVHQEQENFPLEDGRCRVRVAVNKN